MYIWDNLCDAIYHYIAANKVLNKIYYSSYKCCYLITQNSDNLFSSRKYFISIAKLYIGIGLVNINIIMLNIFIVDLSTLNQMTRYKIYINKMYCK